MNKFKKYARREVIRLTLKELIKELSILPENADVELQAVCGYENCGGIVNYIKIENDDTIVLS